MNVLATSRGPVPNVLAPFIGDHGTLVVRAGDKYFVCRPQYGWTADLSRPAFIKLFHSPVPCNLEEGYWGIIPNVDGATNWDAARVQAALDQWIDEHREFKVNGNNMRPLRPAAKTKASALSWQNMDRMIQNAQADVNEHRKVHVR